MEDLIRILGLAIPDTKTVFGLKILIAGIAGIAGIFVGLMILASGVEQIESLGHHYEPSSALPVRSRSVITDPCGSLPGSAGRRTGEHRQCTLYCCVSSSFPGSRLPRTTA